MHVRLSNMPEVDATDARLLLALSEDPRASVMGLSQRLGLARNTVQARLSRLESSGVLAPFERRVRPESLGYRLGAYVTVQVVQRSLTEVSDALADIPGTRSPSPLADLRKVTRKNCAAWALLGRPCMSD